MTGGATPPPSGPQVFAPARGCGQAVLASGGRWLGELRELRRAFGGSLLAALVVSQWALKGCVAGGGGAGWIGQPQDFIFRAYGLDAPSLQVMKAATLTPFALKPFIGIVSDAAPLGGFHKIPYMVAATLAAVVAYFGLATAVPEGVNAAAVLMWVVVMHVALCDLLTEAVYTARMRLSPALGPDLVSFVWGGIQGGTLVSAVTAGPLIQWYGARSCYAVACPVAALVLLPCAANWIGEQRSEHPCCRRLQHGRLVAVGLAIGALSIALAVTFIVVADKRVKLACAIAGCVFLVGSMFWACADYPQVARVNGFFVVQSALTVSIEGAQFYFFTDTPAEYPGGPHFSAVFYVTALSVVTSIFSIVGIWAYNRYMSSWTYRSVVIVGNVIQFLALIFSCIVFKRWNLRLGISDEWFVATSTAVTSVTGMLTWIPGMLLVSQLCPQGAEATMFALLAGSQNLGSLVGASLGAFLLEVFGVRPSGAEGEAGQFERLWMVAAVSSALPLLPLLLVRQCIPDVPQRERLLAEGCEASPSGHSMEEQGLCEDEGTS